MASIARRAGSLSASGQWAAFLLGTLVVAAGWSWGALLLTYFMASSALTRLGAARKRVRTESVLPVQPERDARQVAANGGLFCVLVVLGEATGDPRLLAAGLGALAAAAADTWATEIGLLWGGTPRSILSGRPMAAGESGGVTLVGTMATVIAAALVAFSARWLVPSAEGGWNGTGLAIMIAGAVGSLGDSVLGATVQSRRWCEQCRTWTERRVHTCQYRTQHASGLRWMNNDAVNFLATAIGAVVALVAAIVIVPR